MDFVGTANSDSQVGTDENDRLTGNGGDDVQIGNAGNDTLDGGDGSDLLDGGSGSDTLLGGAGDDLLIGGSENDTLNGGAGNDIYVIDASDVNASGVLLDTIIDSAGIDTIESSATITIASLSTTANLIENVVLVGTGNINATGNSASNTLSGNSGNNTLDGGAGADTMAGGTGNDTYVVDNAGDIVREEANEGNDTILTSFATVDLSSMNNIENLVYTGTAAFTGIGDNGANSISGSSGNDMLSGGQGNDVLNGGAGADTLDGGTGDDTLIGGDGNDIYVVDSASDVVSEGANGGNDTIRTTLNTVALGSYANIENATFIGSGNASLSGTAAANILTGAAGDDTLDGGTGADTLIGGAGNDTYAVDNTADLVSEAANQGTDTIRTTLNSLSLNTTALGNVENLTFTGSGSFTGTGNALANTITGGTGNDTLDGGTGADAMIGGAGDDIYVVDNAGDTITEDASAGTDTVRTVLNAYTLGGNLDNLSFTGTGAFTGTGNELSNAIAGGTGNDTLDGGTGADTLTGGAGNDLYIVDDMGDVVSEIANAGTDTIQTTATSLTLGDNIENLTYTGGSAFTGTGNALANTITGGTGNDILSGGAGNDALSGGAGNDTLDGGTGNDAMTGGGGDDTYIVDVTGDTVTEGASGGNDTVRTGVVGYTLGANLENLVYTGTANFTGTGNELANILTGGSGNDSLDGGTGADTLIGGAGDDTYVVDTAGDVVSEDASAGTDTVRTNQTTYTLGSNLEKLVYTGTTTVAFSGTGNDLDNAITGGSGNDTLDGGAGNDTLDGGTGNDTLIGGAGDDVFIVDSANDVVSEAVGGGNDTVRTSRTSASLQTYTNVENLTFAGSGGFTGTGNSGDNVLTGGNGNDTLTGGAGNDTLIGNGGNDTLIGGTGNDIFVVDVAGDLVSEASGEGTDTIQTVLSSYSLNTAGLANVENLTYTGTGTVAFTGTGNAGSNVITGGNGADTLDGGAGNDTLVGGLGNDTYVVDTLSDVVSEDVSSGTDTIKTALTSYSIATNGNVENLSYTGTAAFTGTGNSGSNVITSGAGNDILDGGTGADTLIGGAGNDTYLVEDAGDVVSETANAGIDTIQTTLNTLSIAALTNVENVTFTGTGDFSVTGNTANNVLTGDSGNDTLDGGAGNDILIGGTGNDTYVVDSASDVVSENAGEGTDTISTTLTNYTLGNNVESLVYTGSVTFIGNGNGDNNTITGGTGNDSLNGGDGNDTLYGGAGNDVLTGGLGDDVMAGGGGNDTYKVNGIGDVVSENAGEGTDTVRTVLASYTLGANVENLVFEGASTDAFTGTGNELANQITGGNGEDTLIGGAGDDTLIGGAGNDTLIGGTGTDRLMGGAGNDVYIIDDATDQILEAASGGTDEIRTSLDTYSLLASQSRTVENLVYTGSGNFTGTGNQADNVITGGSGDDTLDGRDGNDVLEGGDGHNTLLGGAGFDTAAYSSSTQGVTVTVENGGYKVVHDGVTDSLTSIESIRGSTHSDLFTGGSGSDLFEGQGEADVIDGGDGIDFALYTQAASGVSVNLQEGSAIDDSGATDTLFNIEGAVGSASADILIGSRGDNTLEGMAGNDIIDGGRGHGDFASYSRSTAGVSANLATGKATDGFGGTDTLIGISNLEGSAFADTLTGDITDNILRGGAGNDTLIGGDGNDTIDFTTSTAGVSVNMVSGTANDGMGGTDTISWIENIIGSGFADTLTGNASDNTIRGGLGNDTIDGGNGSDTASYADATVGVTVNLGTGTATGGAGTDKLIAIESVLGSALDDVLTGGTTANTLTGGAGNDTLDGGTGDDTYAYAMGVDGNDVITDAAGTDTLRLVLDADSHFVSSATQSGNTLTFGFSDGGSVTINNQTTTTAINKVEVVRGSAQEAAAVLATAGGTGNDLLIATADGTSINGAGGNDIIFAGAGSDTVYGGADNDILLGEDGNDTLFGDDGNDTLIGGNGANILNGGAGEDVAGYYGSTAITADLNAGTVIRNGVTDTLSNIEDIEGSLGNDTIVGDGNGNVLTGFSGNDTLIGGDGSDDLEGGAGNDTLAGGDGADTADYEFDIDGVSVNLATGTALDGWGGTDTLTDMENVLGSAFNDTIIGDSGGNFIVAGKGNDTISAGAGYDLIRGGAGNDSIDGGADIDTVDYSYGATTGVTVNLSATQQVVNGSTVAANTAIDGLGGTDSLSNIEAVAGTSFADVLIGSAGNDSFSGGSGSDTITGGDGVDTANYTSAASGIKVNLSSGSTTLGGVTVAAGKALDGDSGTDTLTGIENIQGSAFADMMVGGNEANTLIGWGGNDTIDGGAGDDVLAGVDGNDTLIGGAGNDSLDGGAGNDVFVFGTGSGTDRIANFVRGEDKINVAGYGYTTFVNLTITESSGDSIITLTGGSQITVQGVTGLTATDFQFANPPATNGTSGNDTINSTANADLLQGGTGNDTYVYTVGTSGSDSINDSAGSDTLLLKLASDQSAMPLQVYQNGSAVSVQMEDRQQIDASGIETVSVALTNGSSLGSYTLRAASLGGTAGADLLYSGSESGQNIDGLAGNDLLSGYLGNDTLIGNSGADVLLGGAGNDTLYGEVIGADADGADDKLSGGTGNDTLFGGAGNDQLRGGEGTDTLDGGAGTDTVFFDVPGANGVTVDFAAGTATDGLGGTDTLIGVEGAIGTAGADRFVGGTGTYAFTGLGGNDTFVGANNTTSGTWTDVRYDLDTGGVKVNLATTQQVVGGTTLAAHTAIDGFGATDTFVEGTNTWWDVTGSANADYFRGADGRGEWIQGMAGNDTIDGGTGTDDIAGYVNSTAGIKVNLGTTNAVLGGITVAGGRAADGFGTTDTLIGIEKIDASNLADYLQGGDEANTLWGWDGNDWVDGGLGSDSLDGGAGNDTLLGNAGNDVIDGGNGNDTLSGGVGNDTLSGGAGSDVFIYNGTTGNDVIVDFQHGTDKIDLSAYTSITSLSNLIPDTSSGNTVLTLPNGQIVIQGVVNLDANDFIFASSTPVSNTAATITSTTASQVITTTGTAATTYIYNLNAGGSDTITDGGGADTLWIKGGPSASWVDVSNVSLQGGDLVVELNDRNSITIKNNSVETLRYSWDDEWGSQTQDMTQTTAASTGNDLLIGTSGADVMNGGLGADMVAGDLGNDIISGGGGSDELFGGAGNDTLYGNSVGDDSAQDEDFIRGGDGNDTLFGQGGNDELTGGRGSDTLNGGDGFDEASYVDSPNSITVTLTNGMGTVIDGWGNTDTLIDIEDVWGTVNDDVMTFGAGNTENLNFVGGAGNDTLVGTSGNWGEFVKYDLSTTGAKVNLSSSQQVVGTSTLAAGKALDGLGYTDTLIDIDGVSGTSYDDILVGGGDSFLRGGKGADTLVGTGANDRISYAWGGPLGVKVNLSGTQVTVAGTALAASKAIDEFGTTDTLININHVSGSQLGDLIAGNAANNHISGEAGNDVIDGQSGNDTLTGGTGNDTLIGGAGNDSLEGGDGNDVFVFATGSGADVITDFAAGDKIDLSAYGIVTRNQVNMSNSGSNVVISLGNGNTITILNTTTDSLTDGNFTFAGANTVSGATTGANTLNSTAAADLMQGLAGDDLYVYEVGKDGTDTIIDSAGTDTLKLVWGSDLSVQPTQIAQSGTTTVLSFDDRNSIAMTGIDSIVINEDGGTITFTPSVSTPTGGNDVLWGNLGTSVVLDGGAGSDIVSGNTGNDVLTGGASNDFLLGGAGNDTLYGETNGGDSENASDVLVGGDGNDTLFGGGGDDDLRGGAGTDTLNGGSGFDQAWFTTATSGITFDLTTNTAVDGQGSTDVLINVEAAVGGSFNDTFIANATALFQGNAGNDTFVGGDNSADGSETQVSYGDDISGVRVNLSADQQVLNGVSVAAGTAIDGWGNTDTFTTGTNTHWTIEGSAFNDVLVGSDTRGEHFRGTAGNDTIAGGSDGNDGLAYADADTGVKVNLSSTQQVLGGTTLAAGTALDGQGGTDTLSGIDRLEATEFNDIVFGGNNAETLSTGNGNDTLNGGTGNDVLSGGTGSDVFVFSPNSGADTVTDFVHGTDKIDVSGYGISSTAGLTISVVNTTDTLVSFGGGNNVTLTGTATAGVTSLTASDFTFASSASPVTNTGTLNSSAGNEILSGGTANHTYIYEVGSDGFDTISDTGGSDTLQVKMTPYTPELADFSLTASGTDAQLTFTNGQTVLITNQTGAGKMETVTVMFTELGVTDQVSFTATTAATAGNDLILGGSSPDSISGGDGNDMLGGSGGNDTVAGGLSWDWIFGGDGNDILYGEGVGVTTGTSEDGDMIYGGAGNDTIYGQLGGDELTGGQGNDTLNGGDGWDEVLYLDSPTAITAHFVDSSSSTANWVADGWGTTDTLISIEKITGSAGDDIVIVDDAYSGNVMFAGGAGNDTITGGNSAYAGVDYDSSTSGVRVNLNSSQQIVGGVTLAGNTGLDGLGGTDTLVHVSSVDGSAYNDIIVGNGHWARLNGGAGADTLVGTNDGGNGINIAVYENDGTQGILLNLSTATQNMGGKSVTAGTAIDQYGNTDTLTNINGVAGSKYADSLIGSSGDDYFAGNKGADSIDGGAGSDWVLYEDKDPSGVKVNLGSDTFTLGGTSLGSQKAIDGWGATDSLSSIENARGSDYNDFLRAATSGSTLEGNQGSDTLIGNSGADVFGWNSYSADNSAVDVIQNFGDGSDHISLWGLNMDWSTLHSHISSDGTHSTIDLTGSGWGKIVVQGVNSLDANDFFGLNP